MIMSIEVSRKKQWKKGIPYQTLISGVIHQYVEGELKEK